MARTKAPKVELITSLPSDPVSRSRLKGSVNEIVDLQQQIADLKSQIKDIRAVEKEDHHVSPKFLNALAKREFDYRSNAEKQTAALEQQLETFSEADILMGRGQGITGAYANVDSQEDDAGEEADA